MKPGKKHGLLRCIKQPLFVTECIWFCILTLKFLYFTGITNIYLNRNLDNDKEKGELYVDQKTLGYDYVFGGTFRVQHSPYLKQAFCLLVSEREDIIFSALTIYFCLFCSVSHP